MRKLLIILLAFVLLVAGWWYGSPYWTLHQMQAAAQRGDSQALSAYIDYPAVRTSLKEQLRRTALKGISSADPGSGFGAIGAAFATALINPLIDTMVSPEGLQAAFAQRHQPSLSGTGPKLPKAPERPVVDHDGLDRFTVHDRHERSGTLVFQRHGLGWKLVGFDLPANGVSS